MAQRFLRQGPSWSRVPAFPRRFVASLAFGLLAAGAVAAERPPPLAPFLVDDLQQGTESTWFNEVAASGAKLFFVSNRGPGGRASS
jgi:hypothetical protein